MNYSNLSDIEFEYLCKDVMSRRLSKRLERFAPGRDGGIDLTDNAYARNVIVQVRHYIKTDISGLMRSLEKEVLKVEEQSPQQYYVCCSKALTPDNKKQIYMMFSKFMDSTENIISALELDEFLEASENVDVLRKHFKLWLDSTNILTDILTNDIFLDAETLLSNIEDEIKLFVRTRAFDEAIACLEKRSVLIIVGNPGVGKTVTSKMLVLNYASQGYRVRYTTDGSDLKSLKKSLSQSPKAKEVILLDDCFGQAYFNMKETQENELLALIRHVNISTNKLLIMNSRISIYHEAEDRTPNLVKSLDRKEYRAYVLDMDTTSIEEKAKIFYNHLYFYDVPKTHFEAIKKSRNYQKIVKHKNYNPRIIEFISSPRQCKQVSSNQYFDFIMGCLENPQQIWKNEYERRLAESDRLLLTTLYSLSNTPVPLSMVRQCFQYRVSKTPNLDPSINHFEQALNRLAGSMVNILDNRGIKMLSVANPSVNDFLRAHLLENVPERQAILAACKSVRQLKRFLDDGSYRTCVSELFKDHSILSFAFENKRQKSGFIASWCALNQICDSSYMPYIEDYIFDIRDIDMYEAERASISDILDGLFQEKMCSFYRLNRVICDMSKFFAALENLQLEEIVEVIKHVDWIFGGEDRKIYIEMAQDILQESIDFYCCDIPADTYNGSISNIVEEFYYEEEDGEHFDADSAAALLEEIMIDNVSGELYEILTDLPDDINPGNILYTEATITIEGADSVIMDYVRDDYDDDYHAYGGDQFMDDRILDDIFNR